MLLFAQLAFEVENVINPEMDKNSPCVEHVIFLWKISKCPSIPGDPEEKGWDSELLPWMGPIQEWVWAGIWRVLVR